MFIYYYQVAALLSERPNRAAGGEERGVVVHLLVWRTNREQVLDWSDVPKAKVASAVS